MWFLGKFLFCPRVAGVEAGSGFFPWLSGRVYEELTEVACAGSAVL